MIRVRDSFVVASGITTSIQSARGLLEVTPQCIEMRTQIALAIQGWFLAYHITVNEAARRLHLVPSAASDVINLRIHAMTIDRLLRSWTYIGGKYQLTLEHRLVPPEGGPTSHRLIGDKRRWRRRP
jgi:predicted XRE-type DNA-binding protein